MNKEELKETMKLLYDIMGDEDLVEAISNMSWKLFIKLKEKGFNDEQAMMIVGRYSEQKGSNK